MAAPAKYTVLTAVDVPDRFRQKWQGTLDILADILQVPATLLMRVHERENEVFARSSGNGHTYEERERAPLDTGLYCETVMSTRAELMVPDALADPDWSDNPDVKPGMVSYLGLPIEWPTGHLFGTICALNNRPHAYPELHRSVLQQFRDLVQNDLALIFENHLLKQEVTGRQETARELRRVQGHLQSLARRLQTGRERERALLARELHDDILQNLTTIKMDLDACARQLPEALTERMSSSIQTVDDRIMATIHQVRVMCDNLVPAVLEDLGLPAAIEWALEDFQRRTGTPCEVRLCEISGMAPAIQQLLYRVLQQTLSHVTSAPCTSLTVELKQKQSNTVLRITARGHVPTEPDPARPDYMALGEMKAQAASWGGKLRTWRTPEGLAILQVSMPTAPRMSSSLE